MPCVFGHYVASRLLVLVAAETSIAFGSVFIGLALPVVGIPAVRPAWGCALTPAAMLPSSW